MRPGTILPVVVSVFVLLGTACQPTAPVPPAATSAPAQPTAAGAAAQPTAARPAATTAPAAKAGGQLVYAVVGSDVRILNAILQSDTVSGAITDRIFEPLVQEDPKTGAIIPALAESYTLAPDGVTYT